MKIDKRKTYYKVTNKDENHNGLQYKTGIIKDHLPFNDNPKKSCVKGGMYFTIGELLPKFFGYGSNIRPIRLLKESQVVLDSLGDKLRTDVFEMKDIISFEKWYGKFGDKVDREDLWYFPRYCRNNIKLWYQDVIERISNVDLWCFPRYCSDNIKLWYQDVVQRMSDEDLWNFSIHCKDSKDIWEEEYNKRTGKEKKTAKHRRK